MSDYLRERLARAIAVYSGADEPATFDFAVANAIMPLIREYAERESDARAEAADEAGFEEGWHAALGGGTYADVAAGRVRWDAARAEGLAEGLRESDARAEAAHATGYRQGAVDALQKVIRIANNTDDVKQVYRWAVANAGMLHTPPDSHPGGTQ